MAFVGPPPCSTLLQELAEGIRSRPVKQGIELRVAAHAGCEAVSISLTQRSDAGRAVLVANLAVVISATPIKTRAAIL